MHEALLYVGFTEVPSSQVVYIGEEAVFRCRHPNAYVVGWNVNGSGIGQTPSLDITPGTDRDDNGTLVNTLTIIARPQYNGTVVECVAIFIDGTSEELSQPVVLRGIW